MLDLADGNAAIEPGKNRQNALNMLGAEQPMPLGRTLRHNQAISPFPGAQGHGIDASLASHLTNGQPAFIEGLCEVGAHVCSGAGVEWGFHQIAFRRLRFSGCGCR
ncbi:hypothetical protein D3C85_1586870 [compost metagenome]